MVVLIGVSGCTNGGKTTLCKLLLNKFTNSAHICQDTFFLPKSQLEFREDLNSHNYDTIDSIDSEKFFQHLDALIDHEPNYDFIFIDGFLLYKYDQQFLGKLRRKYFFTLTKEQCLSRRLSRNYKTVGSLDYFEKLAWPCYSAYYEYCSKTFVDIVYFDGNQPIQVAFNHVKNDLLRILNSENID
jgi:uridine kinase